MPSEFPGQPPPAHPSAAHAPQPQAAPQLGVTAEAPVGPHLGAVEQELAALRADNARLSAQLEALAGRQEAAVRARGAVIGGGMRVLVPLLDRNGVVRSFSGLVHTASGFAGPPSGWPSREALLDAARVFGEACVRFSVRRRMFLLLFSLIATAIPLIQVYLVVQQNEIIENQNEFFRIQVYDVVSRSMTEGNRNARLMTGALLANAEPEFLADVVQETFDPELAGVWRADGAGASERRLQDAAFRGYLVHAVRRSVEHQVAAGATASDLAPLVRGMVARVVEDAADRVPAVLGLGGAGGRSGTELDEQVDNYLAQVGAVLKLYGQIARATGDTSAFFAAVGTLLTRSAKMKIDGNRFEVAYRVALEDFLLDLGNETRLGGSPVAPEDAAAREAGRTRGIDVLRAALGDSGLDWDALARQGTTP